MALILFMKLSQKAFRMNKNAYNQNKPYHHHLVNEDKQFLFSNFLKSHRQKNKEKFSVLVFGGTWCHDTQNILPAFYKLADKSNYPPNKIYLIGVDRAKTTIQQLHTKYKITNVPTFIILNNAGKEIGRVVEYGKSGMPDKDLGAIVNGL